MKQWVIGSLMVVCVLVSTSILAKGGGKGGGFRVSTPSFKNLGIQSSKIQINGLGSHNFSGKTEGKIFFNANERAEIDRRLAGEPVNRVVGEIEIGGTKRKIIVNADE